ncbi:hypothetical protein EW026_g5010 [Hermanssonia centrifuga]|uniref:Uncharacterized protein n=1 Tax=Hermanssonia centrifuga TaxID=98765 RepID=A0A4S4KFN6_9APHY|nr:hypothetical protein EW026_g5010 [Hermanssonia centrifuga]
MFSRLATLISAAAFIVAVEARTHASRSPAHEFFGAPSLNTRSLTGQTIAFSCYGGGGDCECPSDLNGDSGVLINVYPGYQCAYPNGACTWDDKTGALQNIFQTNCPSSHACSQTGGCSCPSDNNGDAGVLINQFTRLPVRISQRCLHLGLHWESAKHCTDQLPHEFRMQAGRSGFLIAGNGWLFCSPSRNFMVLPNAH